jgi:UDP-GlcNAc:undecaprenyl-phosphate/decaprenyl-phosphate GlcNAc-1-phosphate transferase
LGAGPILLAALAVAWLTNLYNFMDGADGLAGGMTFIGFLFYGTAASLAGTTEFAALSFSVAAAAAAFLVFNFHPARVFLGDAGSVPLGFLAAAFGLLGWLQHSWPWWFPVLVFSAFIVDATVTLARRLVGGERVWEAHRDHYYQRLVQIGWGHRRTAVAEYGLMLISGLLALATLSAPTSTQAVALGATAAAYAGMIAWIERVWSRRAAGAQR